MDNLSQIFKYTISSWDDWGKLYQNLPAFTPLIHAIFEREKLEKPLKLSRLTPGTNAVFRADDLVVKIFTPPESGLDGSLDFATEKAAMQAATARGISCPQIIASGAISARYLWHYIVMEHLDANDAGNVLAGHNQQEAISFAARISELCRKLNEPFSGLPEVDFLQRLRENERLNRLPAPLKESFLSTAASLDLSEKVLVHGDITAENILVDKNEVYLIDFADSQLAPTYYELAPITFELFRSSRAFIDGFKQDMSIKDYAELLKKALAIHDFGADIITSFCSRFGYDIDTMHSLDDVIAAFLEVYEKDLAWKE